MPDADMLMLLGKVQKAIDGLLSNQHDLGNNLADVVDVLITLREDVDRLQQQLAELKSSAPRAEAG